MKFGNYIILTLVDFRRHFDLDIFWHNCQQFVRDFSPEKVMYANEAEERAYGELKALITENKVAKENLTDFSQYLSCLAGPNHIISESDLMRTIYGSDYTAQIIRMERPVINLPGRIKTQDEAMSYSRVTGKPEILHKIEAGGELAEEDDQYKIYINGILIKELEPGQAVYVTEIDGAFLRALPNTYNLGNGRKYGLKNRPGEFLSDLWEIDRSGLHPRTCPRGECSHFFIENGQLKRICMSNTFSK